jgi:hypothetical protein
MRTVLRDVHAQLAWVPAVALCDGCALYLLGFVALRWRVDKSIGGGRPLATVVFALLTPAAASVSALVAVALVSVVWICLHAYELIRWRDQRARRRAQTRDAVTAG